MMKFTRLKSSAVFTVRPTQRTMEHDYSRDQIIETKIDDAKIATVDTTK